jgi:GT2 family glycosyltransferase
VKLSVVVPTHDRSQVLLRVLDGLGEQTLPRDAFEVIVVDDGSRPEHREKLRAFRAPYELHVVEKPQGGLASARNAGADRARGSYLLFLDDDVMPDRDLLREHLAAHDSAGRTVAVVGALPYPPHVRMTTFLWYLERSGHYDLYRHPDKYPAGRPPMPPLNGNSSIPRAAFFDVGRYDESFSQYGSEDLDLGYRLARAGIPFVYDPRAVGYHDHVKDFPQFLTDMERAGESLIQLYRKHPDIRGPKKIDIVEDRLRDLPADKKFAKIVLETTARAPWLLALPLAAIRIAGPVYALRNMLFPFYRWVSHYHYAVGMRRAIATGRRS